MKAKSTMLALALLAGGLSTLAQENKKIASDKIIGDLSGTWRIQTIYEGKKDITSSDTTRVQWMEFTEDGHYKSVTGTLATDSGSYRVNENHKILYLESAVDKDTDHVAEWKVELKDSNLTLYQTSSLHAQRYRFVYIKTKDKSNENRPVKPQQ